MFSAAASADLATDLQNLSPEQAVKLALQQEGAHVLEVIRQAAELLKLQPEALAQAVAAAVRAHPNLATQIVFIVVQIAPDHKTLIAEAAAAQVSDPIMKAAIAAVAEQAAQQLLAGAPGSNGDAEVEAEQTEVLQDTAVVIPPPPVVTPTPPPVVTPTPPPPPVSPS